MKDWQELYENALKKYVISKGIFHRGVETMEDSELMAKVFEYCIIMREEDGLEDFLNTEEDNTSFFKRKIAEKFGLVDTKREDNLKLIRDYLKEMVIENGYVSHTTNSLYAESIKEHGMSLKNNKENSTNLLEELKEVFPEGFFKTDLNYLESQTGEKEGWYHDRSPYHFKRYANGPEWFKRLTHSYSAKKDYEGAKGFLLGIMEYYHEPEEKKEKAIRLLDKYWKMYAPTTPHLLLVSTTGHDLRSKEEKEYIEKLDINKQIEYYTDFYFRITDQAPKETIPAKSIVDIDMIRLIKEYKEEMRKSAQK